MVLGSYQPKAAHEIIKENNRIIENFETNEVFSLEVDYSIIDQIAQDNAIIDSKIANKYQPLDFEIINCI